MFSNFVICQFKRSHLLLSCGPNFLYNFKEQKILNVRLKNLMKIKNAKSAEHSKMTTEMIPDELTMLLANDKKHLSSFDYWLLHCGRTNT